MRTRSIVLGTALAATLGGGVGLAEGAGPSTIGSCSTASLQAAVAAGGDWVFACSNNIYTPDPPPLSGSPADSEWQQPFVLSPGETLTLDANGHQVTIDGQSMSRIFVVPAGAVLRLRGVTLTNGAFLGDGTFRHRLGWLAGVNGTEPTTFAQDGNPGSASSPNGGIGDDGLPGGNAGPGESATTTPQGGAIYNAGRVELDHVTLTQNRAGAGFSGNGGIGGNGGGGGDGGAGWCTPVPPGGLGGSGGNGGNGAPGGAGGNAGSPAAGEGGAIYNAANAALLITASTFSHNTADGGRGGDGGAAGNGGAGGRGGVAGRANAGGNGGLGAAGPDAGSATDGAPGLGGAIYNAGTATIGGGTTFTSDIADGRAGGTGGRGGDGGHGGSGDDRDGCSGSASGDPGKGGASGSATPGRDGADGRGGGIFNAASGALTLAGTTSFTGEMAEGGDGGAGGRGGTGGERSSNDVVYGLGGTGHPGGDGGDGGDAIGGAVDSLGTLNVSSTTLAGATATCFAGVHGVGGQGGQDGDGFHTAHPDGNDGLDGSACAAGPVTHSGPFTTLSGDQGEPSIPPFPSGGGSTGSGGGGASSTPTPPPSPTPTPGPTPTPAPGPTPTPVPAHHFHFLTLKSAKLVSSHRGTVTLTLSCPANSTRCVETLVLTTIIRVHATAAHTARKTRTVKLASAKVKVAAGRTAKVHVKLTKAARKLLRKAHGHRLRAILTITAGHRTRRVPVRLALEP